MVSERDVVEENRLVFEIWKLLTSRAVLNDHARLGIDHDMFTKVRSLDQMQMLRALDCDTPLLRFAQPDDVIARLLDHSESKKFSTHIRDEIDTLVMDVNLVFLTNRWSAARTSAIHAECALGMSAPLIARIRNCTVTDLRRAANSDIRLWKIAPHSMFFFHTALNPTLQQSNRTFHATCASSELIG